MGGRESKSCIDYEDASKRVSTPELRRIREAFKRLAGPGSTVLTKTCFLQDVLSERVPPIIADWLFTACGGNQKGITFKDLFCGIVLLTGGSDNEKIRFLWTLYSNDSGTYLLKADFLKSIHLELGTTEKNTNDVKNLSMIDGLNTLFLQGDRVNFDQFKEWILSHKDATVLSKWILSNSCVHLTSELETPTFYQSLAGVTHLEEKDIGDLEKVFWILKASSECRQLDEQTLRSLMSPPIPAPAMHGVFCAFDENQDGHIDFKELCCGVSAACRGPSVERTKFCFKVFDADQDGILNLDEIKQMIDILVLLANETDQKIVRENIWKTLLKFAKSHFENNNQNIEEKLLLNETNTDHEIELKLTQEDYMVWAVESSLNLVQPFLDLLFDVCHVVLGLRPQCKHIEHKIVKGWLKREECRGYQIGQFWYLVSSDWWRNWATYTQSTTMTQCIPCKVNQYIGSKSSFIDEAVICDESLSDSVCETSHSSIYVGSTAERGIVQPAFSLPGHIDNHNLIVPNIYKSIPTLTGEGARLKRNLLSQHRDFELVPDSLWKALAQWYKCAIPLPRQVIRPENSNQLELELYPVNLRILRHQNISSANQVSSTWGAYGAVSSSGSYSISNQLQSPKKYLAYTAAFSRLATVKQISEFLCKHVKIKNEDMRLWHIFDSSDDFLSELLEEEDKSLQDLDINDNDQILLEIRNKDLTWPEELSLLVLSANASQERRATIVSLQQTVHAPGATGLHNLGNTCFINAALQVMFNTQPLAKYFKFKMHLYELNATNNLGTKGVLASRYGELLNEVWTATTRSIAPLKLRFCVIKYAQQFAGGGQHDLQEFMEWLLDALHEDLNRVTDKQYSEAKDSNGRPDEEVALEGWSSFHSRNQSIIIDLFYGQLKSKVTCLCCGNESVRFDPFSLLSLPLPMESYVYCEVLVILLDGSIPVKYGVRMNSESKYFDLKIELAGKSNLVPNLMLICEIFDSQIAQVPSDHHKINAKGASDLVAYELPEGGDDNKSLTSSLVGANIEKGLRDIQRNPGLFSERHTAHNTFTTSDARNPLIAQENEQRGEFVQISKNNSPHSLRKENIESQENNQSHHRSGSEDGTSASFSEFKYRKDGGMKSRTYEKSTMGTYLIAVHRKFSRQDTYFISYHKTRPSLFGIPLLIPYDVSSTNKDLYCAVWMQVACLLSPLPLIPPEQANHATDCDDSLGYDFPFTLRAVSDDGRVCAMCPWTAFCRGCEIPCDNDLLVRNFWDQKMQYPEVAHKNKIELCIAIDWDPTALHLRYQSTREKLWVDHESVNICRKQRNDPIDLNHCLHTFTSEEKLEQWYHCSYCKAKTPATKKLQIWKLPPILIVHLKRFNCVNGRWVKSQKVVNFPFDDLDPTPFLASTPQEMILKYREKSQFQLNNNSKSSAPHESTADPNGSLDNSDKEEKETSIQSVCLDDGANCDNINANNTIEDFVSKHQYCKDQPDERAVKNRMQNPFKDYHMHHLKDNRHPSDVKYKLYSVVSHSGMLNGGHYIAYTQHANGSWYCYNDSSCREIPSTPSIDPSSAYMLFYERKDLEYKPYLPNTENRVPMDEMNIDSENGDGDLRKNCCLM